MKFKTLVTISASILLLSCGKDIEIESPIAGDGEIKCFINGELKSFTSDQGNGLNHYDDNYPGSPNGKLVQMSRYTSKLDVFTIDLWKDFDQIKVGDVYTNANYNFDTDSNPDFLISYVQINNFKTYFSQDSDVKTNTTVKITGKTPTRLAGIFEGYMYGFGIENFNDFNFDDENDGFQMDTILISAGSFNIPIVRGSIVPTE